MNRLRVVRLGAVLFVLALFPGLASAGSGEERALPAPNYELASRWMPSKVGKLVFDTSVTPRWAETSDRFFYTFETAQGRTFQLVDPLRRTKVPLWDNARMAAMLTTLTRVPFDSQHLPMGAARPAGAAEGGGGGEPPRPPMLKWAKNDTVIQFEIEVPKEAKIPGEKPKPTPSPTPTPSPRPTPATDAAAERDPEETKTTKTLYFEYDIASGKLSILHDFEPEPKKPAWAQISPDDKTVIFARGHNLFMMDAENYKLALKDFGDPKIQEVQITTDGIEHYSFARRLNEQARTNVRRDQKGDTKHKDGPRVPAIVLQWAKDSTKFSGVRQDLRKVSDLWVINSLANPRPKLETYRYAMPGEENVDQAELLIFDRETKARVAVKADAFKDQTIQVATARTTARAREKQKTEGLWLSETADKMYFLRNSRDLHRVDVCVADTATGEVKTVIEERLNTYIETQPLWALGNGKEFIHWSERDGWGHYYLFGADGTLKNQITTGEFVTGPITWVDEKLRVMYFTANGREAGQDPYFSHFYRIGLDGKGYASLTPDDGHHSVQLSTSGRYLVDTSSTPEREPSVVLRDATGKVVLPLEKTDISKLVAFGWKPPMTFSVKGRDGKTDIYGQLFRPTNFDPSRKYPIINQAYPGPQSGSVGGRGFSAARGDKQALAELGFVVVSIDGMGTPGRSKSFHDAYYAAMGRDNTLPDQVAGMKELAAKYSWIDIDRAAMWGHSGGGFITAGALFRYPDFFKVGISESGNHDQRVYEDDWGERYQGLLVKGENGAPDSYDIEANQTVAKNLKGKLLLMHGMQDDNVPPENTYLVMDALIKANKDFDLLLLPSQRHGFGTDGPYVMRRRWDYFVKHLLGVEPPKEYKMAPATPPRPQ